MIRHILVPFFLFCTFIACASNQGAQKNSALRPDWVTNPPSQSGYLYGTGGTEIYGSTHTALQQAKEAARVDLLSQLRVTVEGETRTSTRLEESGANFPSIERMVQQQTSSRVQKIEMTGIEFAETWVDPAGKEVWVLARMNRAKTESELFFQLSSLEDRILSRDISQGNKLDRIRGALPTLKELDEREHLLAQLSFLSAGNSVPETGKDKKVEALKKDLRDLLASLTISIEEKNETAEKMQALIAKTITSMGFNLHHINPDLILVLDIKLQAFRKGDLFYCLSDAMGEVQTPEGRTLYMLKESGRGASGLEAQAEDKAVEDVSRKLADSLAKNLFQQP